MINFKKEIAQKIGQVIQIEENELESYIEKPKDSSFGDYAFPCFRLAKNLKKAPPIIANEIKEKMKIDTDIIEKVEVVGGYLNFYVSKKRLFQEVFQEINNKKQEYGSSNIGNGKNIIVEYSSPNIAKPFHIGHLRNTVIGNALYKMYKFLGYNTIGINHLGDYGTQFGKMIEGYKRWGQEYNLEEKPIEELTKIYVRINQLCKDDEEVLDICRDNFRKLEQGDNYCTELWQRFRELSLKEFYRIYDLLGIHFDSLNGEAFYSDKTDEVIEILNKSGKLEESEGAQIIDLEEKGMPPCIICKTNGSTIYATRDLAAILYRARTYDFDKCLYVVAYEQNLHFKQIFEVSKLLGIDEKYTKGLVHVPYGMVHLKSGKMSTRDGNVIKVEELLTESIQRVKAIIEEKNPMLENKEEIAEKIGIGAIIFNDLSTTIIKDEIFDWDTVLNFQGETGPYIQYIYVRTKSVLEKAGYIPNIENIQVQELLDKEAIEVIKLIYDFQETIITATHKNEPSILARFLIDISKAFSIFYNEYKIMVDNQTTQDARLFLTYVVGIVLEIGTKLLGMQMPERM